ncbi:hypothetical protein AB0B89_05635 [Sphaerisporangium sp. NPDC049002]|uniref:hypothetical protein n=1 Tax=unclassified Sphaerisporangium TaxID=2630420 RepID=UPI0034017B95
MDRDGEHGPRWAGGQVMAGGSPLVPGGYALPEAGLPLDYYLIFATAGDRRRGAPPSGVLVEEFLLHDDHTAAGIGSAGWTPATGAWRSSPALSREIRTDALLRERVLPVSRADAAGACTMLGGGALPQEARLRGFFGDCQALPTAAPLDLGSPDGGGGRHYRILFAGDVHEPGLTNLRASLRLEPVGDPADPRAQVIGTATATPAGHTLTWELRRIGPGIAWCLDVTVSPGAGPASAVGALLHHHRQAMRGQGLIPVTIERFA